MSYKFDDNDNTSEAVPVVITEGKYAGIKYNYGAIKFEEEEDGAKLVFDYDILENDTSIELGELDENEEFHSYIGDILVDIIGKEIGQDEEFLRETEVDEDS